MTDETKKTTITTTTPTTTATATVEKADRGEGFIDDLFSLANEGAALIRDVVKPAKRAMVRALEDEPYDPAICFALRSLVMECKFQGGVRLLVHENQIQVIVGDGMNMRVTEASTLGAAVLAMCDKEGVKIDQSRFPRTRPPVDTSGEE